MNQIVFDYVCDQADSKSIEGLTDNNAWDASRFIIDNFEYSSVYEQIDDLLKLYLSKK